MKQLTRLLYNKAPPPLKLNKVLIFKRCFLKDNMRLSCLDIIKVIWFVKLELHNKPYREVF